MALSFSQVQPNYKEIEKLSPQVAFSPESMDQINASEANPRNDIELAKEMARTDLAPNALTVLQEEKDRRASLKTGLSFEDIQPDQPKGLSFDDIKPEEPKLSFNDVTLETPETGKYVKGQLIDTLAAIPKGIVNIGGSLANAAGELVGQTGIADPLLKANAEQAQRVHAENAQPTDANATLPQKVLGMAAGAPMYIAAGPAAPLLAGGTAAVSTATDLVDQGATLGQAGKAGLIAGGLGYAGMKLPSVGKTMVGSAAIGAVTNSGAGALTDLALHNILQDNPDLAKNYNWQDINKRLPEAVFGGIFSFGAHPFFKAAEAKAKIAGEAQAAKIKEAADNFLADGLANLDVHLGPVLEGRELYKPPEGVGVRMRLHELLQPRVDGTPHPEATVQNVLDLLGQVQSFKGDTVVGDSGKAVSAYAEYLGRVARDLGLENVPIVNKRGTQHASHYSPETDTINLGKNGSMPTILHEVGHSLTEHILSQYENSKLGEPIDPRYQKYIEKVKPLDDMYQALLKRKETGEPGFADRLAQSEDDITRIQQLHPDETSADDAVRHHEASHFLHYNYAYKDLHEFVSEFLSKPEFRADLSKVKLHPDDLASMYPNRNDRVQMKNFSAMVKRSLEDVLGAPMKGTILDPIFSHISNIFENVEGRDRTSMPEYSTDTERQNATIKQTFAKGPQGEMAAGILTRIKKLLDLAGSDKRMFMDRMYLENPNSTAWRDFVKARGEDIYINQKVFNKYLDDNKAYFNLSDAEKRWTSDPRTALQMLKEEASRFLDKDGRVHTSLPGTQDISERMTMYATPQVLALMKNDGSVGGRITKWFIDQQKEYIALGNKARARAMAEFKDFNDLKRKDQMKLMDEVIAMNTIEGQNALKAKGLQWADEAMLRERGLGDAQIKAYEGLTKGSDYLWELLNQVQRIQGGQELPRIPGYMPHVFEGAYKVFIKHIGEDGREFTAAVKGFKTRQMANRFIKQLNSGQHDQAGIQFRPQVFADTGLSYKIRGQDGVSDSLSTNLNEHMSTYLNQMKLTPEAATVLEKIERDSMIGINKHMLESSNVEGYLGSHGMKDSWLETMGIGKEYNTKVLKLYENYAKSVTDYYRNTLFVHEVMVPLRTSDNDMTVPDHRFAQLMANTPNLNKFMANSALNFTGQNPNHFKLIDGFLKDKATAAGLDPYIARQFVDYSRNLLSSIKLRLNVPFHTSNVFQPLMIMGMIDLAAAERGGKSGGGATAVGKYAKKATTKGFDKADEGALQWARDAGIVDAQLGHELNMSKTSPARDTIRELSGGHVNDPLETRARERAFLIAFQHTREIYSDPMQARTAAQKLMELTMVDYANESKPLMYQNTGVLGKVLSPFAIFRNAYLGNMALMIGHMAQNPLKASHWKPLVVSQLTFMGLAGMSGTVLMQEYNNVVDMINKIFPEWELKHLEDLLFKGKVPDALTYGIPSAVTGVNMSGSMGSPDGSGMFDVPLAKLIAAAGGMIGNLLSTAKEVPSPWSAAYGPTKMVMPNVIHPFLEMAAQGTTQSNVGNKASTVEGLIERTPDEKNTYMLSGGRQAVSETKKRTVERQLVIEAQQQKVQLRALTEIGADNYMGMTQKMTTKEATERAAALGVSTQEFYQGIKEAVEVRMTTAKQRDAKSHNKASVKRIFEREQALE